VEVFPGVDDDGTVELTTDTTVAVDAFMEGATVTMPTVVTTVAANEEFEVVIVAKAAIAPEPRTMVADDVPEVLEVVVAPDVVDRITGATTAVTTVAVVLKVLDPNPPTELTEFDVVLPTAVTTDVDVLITVESDRAESATVLEAKDLDLSTVEETTVLAEDDCELSDEALVWVCEGAVTEDEEETMSTPEVLAAVDVGLVTPYGFGAKQHIICALDEDLAPLDVTSSGLSIVTSTVEVFPEGNAEFDVAGTLLASEARTAGESLPPDSARTTSSTLSTGCSTG